ncbi:MAG: AraC family transcriptional regulator [Firmicutes bacterium]|nr:AraC family transcriptional regulator [Bacillota bacterium]
MLARKLHKQSFEKETIEYSNKSFGVKFLYADHTNDNLGFIPHSHAELEFLYIVQGEAEINVGNVKHHAKAGDIFVFNSNEIHSCLKTYPSYKTYCLQFLPSFLQSKIVDICEYNYILPMTEKRSEFATHYSSNPELIELFNRCEQEYRNKSKGYHIALKGYIYAMLAHLYRLNTHLLNDTIVQNDPNYKRVNSVLNHIAQNYGNDIDFRKIISDMYLHYSYFSRIFKSQTGKSMRQYLNEYRITIALGLFTNTDKNITEIATTCGFDDLNYFSRSFKQIIGLSPAKVKKAMRLSEKLNTPTEN